GSAALQRRQRWDGAGFRRARGRAGCGMIGPFGLFLGFKAVVTLAASFPTRNRYLRLGIDSPSMRRAGRGLGPWPATFQFDSSEPPAAGHLVTIEPRARRAAPPRWAAMKPEGPIACQGQDALAPGPKRPYRGPCPRRPWCA